MTHKRWFWAAVLLQVLVLFGMMGMHGYTLATGQPVLLKTVPVDPWDLFRGEYVALRYEISQIDAAKVSVQGAPFKRGQQVYVTLREGKPFWQATAVSVNRVAAGTGEMVIRGTFEWQEPSHDGRGDLLRIRYGIEQFYVPQGEGRNLEGKADRMSVEALVDSSGRAALSKVFLDGQEIRWQ